MSLSNRTISNLFGGVSQQPAGIRFDNQCEELINAYPSITDGLVKRPPSEFVSAIAAGGESLSDRRGSMFHTINRDGDEKYIVVFTGDATSPIKIYDLLGAEKTVAYGTLDEDLVFTEDNAKKAYVAGGTPSEDIAATTVADYTLVANRAKTVAMLPALPDTHLPVALITIPHGVAMQTYKIYIDGALRATYTAGDSNNPATWRTTAIASDLATALGASLSAPEWSVSFDGNTIFIMNTLGTDFSLKVEDSWGGQAMIGIKETVRRFEDLPETLGGGSQHGLDTFSISGAAEYYRHYLGVEDPANPGQYIEIGACNGGFGHPDGSYSTPLWMAEFLCQLFRKAFIDPDLATNWWAGVTIINPPTPADPWYSTSWTSNHDPINTYFSAWRTDGVRTRLYTWRRHYRDGVLGAIEMPDPEIAVTRQDPAVLEDLVFAIRGDVTAQNGKYYVRWDTAEENGKTVAGTWLECMKRGIETQFDPTTMPHRLVRMPLAAASDFVFAPIAWEDRAVGDDISAPLPTYVGNQINDIFFFKNRLGFLSKGSSILSRAGEFFDFFPTTATDVLDDDPIDSECSSKQVAVLRYGVPFQSQLVLFSDQQQFSLGSGSELFTPKSAAGDLATTVAVDRCEPVSIGSNIYFASPAGQFSSIREMFVAADTLITDSADVTAHCPSYVPGNIKKIAACEGKDTVFVLSGDDPYSIYVYKFYWNGDEKAQSAWGKWTFAQEVMYMDAIDNYLYILFGQTDGTLFLERINLETKEVTTGLTYRLHLDRQKVLTGTFDTDHTNFISPYPVLSTDRAFNSTTKECVDVTVINGAAGTFSVPGNWAGAVVIFGRPYLFDHRFSEFGQKSSDPKVYSRAGRGQLRTMNLSYVDTAAFDIVVSTVGRPDSTQRFRASAPVTGERRFTTLGDTRTTRVSIRSDSHLPCKFAGMSYEVLYSQRSK